MKFPLLGVAACWTFGILLARFHPVRPVGAGWLLAAASVALLAGLLTLRAGRHVAAVAFLAAGFALGGAVAAALFPYRFPPHHIRNLAAWGFNVKKAVPVEATVETPPLRTSSGFQFDAEVREIGSKKSIRSVTGKVRLRLYLPAKPASWAAADALHLQAGDRIQAPVRFYRPHVYRNPGSFDYQRWMESIEDIAWEGTIPSPLEVRKLAGRGISWPRALVEKIRSRLIDGIDGIYPSWSAEGRDGAVLKAILLGDRSSLDSETIEGFRKSGLYHLLVISGLHVGLLAALALLFLRLLRVREMWRGLWLGLFLFGYALLVEQRAPTLRATLMIALYLLARYLYRDRAGLNAVGFAALILLLVRPAWLFEAGFQLSFSAVLLIFGLAVPILERTTLPYRRALRRINDPYLDVALAPRPAQFRLDLRSLAGFLRHKVSLLDRHSSLASATVTFPVQAILWVADLVLFSAILQIGLLLPMAETFHRITFAGIGLNALAIPVMTVLLGLAVPTVILAAIAPLLAFWPAKLLAEVMTILFALTHLPHLPGWLSYRVPAPPDWVAWGFVLSAVMAAGSLARHQKFFRMSMSSFGIFVMLVSWYPFPPDIPRGVLEVTALDCGRGQATFMVLPDRTTALVDACGARTAWPAHTAFQGRWDPGEDLVSPYLWSRGLKRIDILILSASHPGEMDGMATVVRNFHPRALWDGSASRTPEHRDLLNLAQQQNVRVRHLAAGAGIRRGRADFQVFSPPADARNARARRDNESIILRIAHQSASILLPVEINATDKGSLLRSAALPQSQVLEVHSDVSEVSLPPDFLANVAPRIVLVSGRPKGNGFGRPNDPSWADGVKVFSTDRAGAVTIEMKGSALKVRCYSSCEAASRGASASVAPSGYNVQ